MADPWYDAGSGGATATQATVDSPSPPSRFQVPQIHNLGDLLDWQRAALHEAIFRKGTSDANRAALRDKLAHLPLAAEIPAEIAGMAPTTFLIQGAKHYASMPPVMRGIYDAILDTGTDPLTLETLDLGPLGKGFLKVAGPAFRALDKAVPQIGAFSRIATRVFNKGGDAIIQHGRSAANTAIGMGNRAESEGREIERILNSLNDRIMKGLNPKQTSAVQKILHGQLPDKIVKQIFAQDPEVARAVGERRNLTDALVRMQEAPGGGASQALANARGGHLPPLPPELARFTGRPGDFMATNLRENYFPSLRQAKAVAKSQPERTYNLLDTFNPHTLEQNDFHIPSRQVNEYEDAFRGMLRTSARNIAANRVKSELSALYPQGVPPAIRDIFDSHIPATGTERSDKQIAQEFIKGVIGLPKIGIVGTSPIHMFNILALLVAHDPASVPGAVKNFVNIMRAGGDEEKRFMALLPAIERGIDVSAREKGGLILSHTPFNKMTWDFDTAAKQALSEKYLRMGYKPLDAGVRAANDLVNYRNRSPASKALSYFMPFATFAEGGAKAVLAATARNPAQVEFINRLMGGRFLGGGDTKKDVTLHQPPADVGRGLPNYLRAKTSDAIKLPLALAAKALPGGERMSNWLLSGRTPAATALDIGTSWIPLARSVMDVLPIHGGKTIRGYQASSPLSEGVFSSTGVLLPRKPAAPPTAPTASTQSWYEAGGGKETPIPGPTVKPGGNPWYEAGSSP